MWVNGGIRACGAIIVVAAVVGFLAARQYVANVEFVSQDRYEVGAAVVVLIAAAVGLLHRPTGLGSAMFGLAAVIALFLLRAATKSDIEQGDYIYVDYFGLTLGLGLLGLFALAFGPRPDPNDPSPLDRS
jgi:hypothetical protein